MACCDVIYYSVFFLLTIIILLKIRLYFAKGVSTSNTCLVGKTVIITGGNEGLGYQTALALAARGARIIIADKNDATESVNRVRNLTGNLNVFYKHIELSSLASVRHFAKEILKEEDRLDILVNNAGISGAKEVYTEDGLQLGMQINHFGPFLLTLLLIDLLKKSAPSRIIFVSSVGAFMNYLTLDNLNKGPDKILGFFATIRLYGNAKLMNIITSNMLSEKLHNTGVTSNALCTGCANTPIFGKIGGPNRFPLIKLLIYKVLLPLFGKSPWEGAQTQIECALSKDLKNVSGKFFVDCTVWPMPKKAEDRDFCKVVWKKSEELVKCTEVEKLI